MSFDIFVQSCITLKRMTDVFKRYDEDRDGYVTFAFEEFLTGECIHMFSHYGERERERENPGLTERQKSCINNNDSIHVN